MSTRYLLQWVLSSGSWEALGETGEDSKAPGPALHTNGGWQCGNEGNGADAPPEILLRTT